MRHWIIFTLIFILLAILYLILPKKVQPVRKIIPYGQPLSMEFFDENVSTHLLCCRYTNECDRVDGVFPCCASKIMKMLNISKNLFEKAGCKLYVIDSEIKNNKLNLTTPCDDLSRFVSLLTEAGFSPELTDELTVYYSKKNRNALVIHVSDYQPINQLQPPLLLTTNTHVTEPNYDVGIQKCFVIADEGRDDRSHAVMNEFDKQGLVGEQIKAVMWNTFSMDNLERNGVYTPKWRGMRYGLRSRQVGCYLSHVEAIKKVSKQPIDDMFCLIVEDDVRFCPNFQEVMGRIYKHELTPDIDILFLGVSTPRHVNSVSKYLAKASPNWGAWAYMLTPKSARKILPFLFPVDSPIDALITVGNDYKAGGGFESKLVKHLTRRIINVPMCNTNMKRLGIIDETSTGWDVSSTNP